jgi:hypothetical protein
VHVHSLAPGRGSTTDPVRGNIAASKGDGMSTTGLRAGGAALAFGLLAAAGCGGGGTGPGGGSGQVRELTFPAGVRGSSPRFSRDGTRLSYVREEGSVYQVAVMTPAGTDSVSLASDGNYLTSMTWAPGDAEILYYSENGIRAVLPAGGGDRFVHDAFAAIDPDLSPDGSSLVYGVNGGMLQLADLLAAPSTEVDLGPAQSESPRFSPDGSRIAFWSGGKISLMDLATRTVTDVLDTDNSFGGVDWFSDGQRLLAGTDRGIEIVALGPPVTRTLIGDVFALMDVDLSPDDASVAYGKNGQPQLFVLSGF